MQSAYDGNPSYDEIPQLLGKLVCQSIFMHCLKKWGQTAGKCHCAQFQSISVCTHNFIQSLFKPSVDAVNSSSGADRSSHLTVFFYCRGLILTCLDLGGYAFSVYKYSLKNSRNYVFIFIFFISLLRFALFVTERARILQRKKNKN